MIHRLRMRWLCRGRGRHAWAKFHNFDTGATWYECLTCGKKQ